MLWERRSLRPLKALISDFLTFDFRLLTSKEESACLVRELKMLTASVAVQRHAASKEVGLSVPADCLYRGQQVEQLSYLI